MGADFGFEVKCLLSLPGGLCQIQNLDFDPESRLVLECEEPRPRCLRRDRIESFVFFNVSRNWGNGSGPNNSRGG